MLKQNSPRAGLGVAYFFIFFFYLILLIYIFLVSQGNTFNNKDVSALVQHWFSILIWNSFRFEKTVKVESVDAHATWY